MAWKTKPNVSLIIQSCTGIPPCGYLWDKGIIHESLPKSRRKFLETQNLQKQGDSAWNYESLIEIVRIQRTEYGFSNLSPN